MELTTFCGKIKEWPTFWNIFEETNYYNNEGSTIKKLRYLRNVIKVLALAHIRNMEIKAEKNKTAIKIMEQNYNRSIQAGSNLFSKNSRHSKQHTTRGKKHQKRSNRNTSENRTIG
jgi:16S rRNA G527 N7-methylase RsmG